MSETCTRRLAVTVLAPTRPIWGSERSILNMAPHLGRLGIDLTLAAPPDGDFAGEARELGLEITPFEVDAPPATAPRRLQLLAREAGNAPRYITRIARVTRGADVVHCNSLVLHPAAAGAGRLRRRPTVLELHDIVTPGAAALLLSGAAALSSAVVSISGATEAPVRGPGAHRVHRVPQAIDLGRFTPGPADQRLRELVGDVSTVVGVVGRVDPSKGIDTLVRAVGRLGEDIGLLVVGAPSLDAGGHLAEVRELGEQLLGGRFHYAGPTDDVARVLRSLDVLVNASDAEPFGLSILEAQACGVPVIGTASGGIPDFVDDERTGLLVPPRDEAALAAALDRLRHDHQLRSRLESDALATVREKYGIVTRAAALAALYRSVAR